MKQRKVIRYMGAVLKMVSIGYGPGDNSMEWRAILPGQPYRPILRDPTCCKYSVGAMKWWLDHFGKEAVHDYFVYENRYHANLERNCNFISKRINRLTGEERLDFKRVMKKPKWIKARARPWFRKSLEVVTAEWERSDALRKEKQKQKQNEGRKMREELAQG